MSRQHPSSHAMLVGVRFVKDGLEAILVTETGSELIALLPERGTEAVEVPQGRHSIKVEPYGNNQVALSAVYFGLTVPVHIFPRTGGENNERWTPDDVIR
jgi:hypothetical protein